MRTFHFLLLDSEGAVCSHANDSPGVVCLSVRGRPCSGAVGVSEHWDQPYMQGTGQSQGHSESSQSAVQAALQGLTCEKKTKSILAKGANLYSTEKQNRNMRTVTVSCSARVLPFQQFLVCHLMSHVRIREGCVGHGQD